VVRAGQMMDETKTASKWPLDVSMRFLKANAEAGVNVRERPLSHYNSVADTMRAIVDTPPDLHIGLATLSARRP
jgi:meso-butanediol dehydrogenase / (S,S)-butanediol dehydrogenase / diacetyl reductase